MNNKIGIKEIGICIMLVLIVIFAWIGTVTAANSKKSTPVLVTLTEQSSNDTSGQPTFNYILVKETDKYYLHKLKSWTADADTITFKCSVCGVTIRAPKSSVAMYDKVTLKTAWSDYADVCSGEASDWHEMLAE